MRFGVRYQYMNGIQHYIFTSGPLTEAVDNLPSVWRLFRSGCGKMGSNSILAGVKWVFGLSTDNVLPSLVLDVVAIPPLSGSLPKLIALT